MPEIAAKIALVTGAGSGIGRAVSLALGRQGFTVVLTGRRQAELEQTAFLGAGLALHVAPADVTQPKAVHELFADIEARFGRLDLLFNNAGTGAPAVPLDELTFEQWLTVVNVNLNDPFLFAQHPVPVIDM